MAPPLMDDLIEECLLRLPPDDPANLVRAALVCKRWRRIVADHGFSRRFRQHHRRAPLPLLGYLEIQIGKTSGNGPCFTPTTPFFHARNADLRGRHAIDARHGRVLLSSKSPYVSRATLHRPYSLAVWDPITGDQVELPDLPPPHHPVHLRFGLNSRATVLCAGGSGCDHLDCHRGHFLVVFMDASESEAVRVYVYSSEAGGGAWSHTTSAAQKDLSVSDEPIRLLYWKPVALAGNALYFSAVRNEITTGILRYDLGTHRVSWVDLPPDCSRYTSDLILLTTTTGYDDDDDGGLMLGIAGVDLDSRIHLWSWSTEAAAAAPSNGGGASASASASGWAPRRAIEFETALPADSGYVSMVTFVHGLGAFFIKTNGGGTFSVDLESHRVKKVFGNNIGFSCFVPYTSFFTPALGAAFTGEAPTGVPSA